MSFRCRNCLFQLLPHLAASDPPTNLYSHRTEKPLRRVPIRFSSVWELNQAFSRSPELREVLWKSSVASSIRLSAGARTSSATSKGSQVCIFFVCLPFADDKACVFVVVSPALRSLRRCQAIARRRDLSDQHQPIASLEATNRECGRNPRCQLLLEASSQLFSSGRHPGSHQL